MAETTVRRVGASRALGLAPLDDHAKWFWWHCSMEVERARRHGRSFTVLRVRWAEPHPSGITDAADEFRHRLRRPDAVMSMSNQILILLNETAGAEAIELVRNRLAPLLQADLPGASWDAVSFPEDALTYRSLVEQIYGVDGDAGQLLVS